MPTFILFAVFFLNYILSFLSADAFKIFFLRLSFSLLLLSPPALISLMPIAFELFFLCYFQCFHWLLKMISCFSLVPLLLNFLSTSSFYFTVAIFQFFPLLIPWLLKFSTFISFAFIIFNFFHCFSLVPLLFNFFYVQLFQLAVAIFFSLFP